MEYQKLLKLEMKYTAILASEHPNMDQLRRVRDQIIKLKFDLGLI